DSAVKANALKSDFIKNLSYEIRIPLQAINEYSRLIADCADPGTKEYLRNFTDLIEHNSELLTTIINDVIHLSELESDTMNVQRQLVSLRVLCRTVVETLRSRVKNPDLKIRLASNLPDIQINSDQSRVQQILLNLLINAVKFTPKGTITLGYKVDEDKNEVNFYVEDTGIGINPENKEKIFERFVKLDSNTQGAGLGLTISRMLARLLGGDLSLDTSYLGGARFVLSLPR
ncbi:MAG: HAMP domain-containing histidine kinase, partial [Duncaniella sp.]|nr:HAMP domain-containing histidine kinase [Duncaniella sp.]